MTRTSAAVPLVKPLVIGSLLLVCVTATLTGCGDGRAAGPEQALAIAQRDAREIASFLPSEVSATVHDMGKQLKVPCRQYGDSSWLGALHATVSKKVKWRSVFEAIESRLKGRPGYSPELSKVSDEEITIMFGPPTIRGYQIHAVAPGERLILSYFSPCFPDPERKDEEHDPDEQEF